MSWGWLLQQILVLACLGSAVAALIASVSP